MKKQGIHFATWHVYQMILDQSRSFYEVQLNFLCVGRHPSERLAEWMRSINGSSRFSQGSTFRRPLFSPAEIHHHTTSLLECVGRKSIADQGSSSSVNFYPESYQLSQKIYQLRETSFLRSDCDQVTF